MNVIDKNKFLVSFDKKYHYYELKNNEYKCTKNAKLEDVNLDELKK